VLSSSASLWRLGVLTPFAFRGFFSPVDNPPVVNVASAARAIPVKFSLHGNQGLSIFGPGSPSSVRVDCATAAPLDEIEETVTAGSSSLSYDAARDQYTYVWKAERAWAGTCRQLTLALVDGTVHKANFKFK